MKKDSVITVLDSARKIICSESNCKSCFLNEVTKRNEINMCNALTEILDTLEDNKER